MMIKLNEKSRKTILSVNLVSRFNVNSGYDVLFSIVFGYPGNRTNPGKLPVNGNTIIEFFFQ